MSIASQSPLLKKDEFIQQASARIQNKLEHSSSKDSGKEYQDALVAVLNTAIISVPAQFSSVQSNKKLLISILSDIPLIDDELYTFFINQRRKYIQHKPFGKTRDEYITWTKTVEESIATDKDLKRFAKQRVVKNRNIEKEKWEKYLERLDRQHERLDKLLHDQEYMDILSDQTKSFLQQALGELRELRVGYDDRYEIYHNDADIEKNVYQLVQKLWLVLKKYILSRNHADENLRAAYIEIFLGGKIENAVTFHTGPYHLNFLQTHPFNQKRLEQLLDGYEKRGVQLSLFPDEIYQNNSDK